MIYGQLTNGVFSKPFGVPQYPILTEEASMLFSLVPINETNWRRWDSDMFDFLFVKWLNNTYHSGWLLRHTQPVFSRESGHGALAEEDGKGSNLVRFVNLPVTLRNENIFFNNPTTFKSGTFVYSHLVFFVRLCDFKTLKQALMKKYTTLTDMLVTGLVSRPLLIRILLLMT